MTTLKKIIPALLVTILLLFPSFQNVQAKDSGMEDWLVDTANPAINNIVTEFNNTTQENWYVNLSSHLIEGDYKKTTEKLGVLHDDIKSMKKEVENIKAPRSAKKKDKKQIKAIKKNLTKSLKQTDASVKKLTKRIEKDKKIKVIKPRKSEQKNMSKVNAAYVELNDSHSVDTPPLGLISAIKIDQEAAEKIVHDYNEEQKKIAAKKAEVKKKEEARKAAEAEVKAKEEAEKKRLAEEKAAEEEAKRLEEEKKAEELARAEQHKAGEEAKRLEEEKKAEELAKAEQQKAEEEAKIFEEEQKKEAIAPSNEPEWFQNCTELRKKYPNGVASDHPAYQSKMDRDKDDWACER